MDRKLYGYMIVLALLVFSNTVFAECLEMGSRRFQSDADTYVRHHFVNNRHSRWQAVTDIRTRRHHTSDSNVVIARRVSAVQLQGLKRTAFVKRAFAETRRGRMIHLPELEGRLFAGATKTTRLKKSLYIRNLVLEVDSPRHKRAYVRVNVQSKTYRDRAWKGYSWR